MLEGNAHSKLDQQHAPSIFTAICTGSEHQNEKSLLKIMRNTIDSPGESDLFQVASNVGIGFFAL